ncbi:PQQ-binding-like beta-propeller repeat protein [Rhodococcus triatomae]|uniref:PQQ-like domain-containing protein n=1 Tax=Rhodococcus triatomae TaxID=300028 RepID=A0A1G8F7A0_9NOCA|nr:PQQ-binding-like beta-propeller repeat protein [Rhodococcus triatomae]QNG19407.1 PQQ-binding-like beta-propeller repeat protein [Rhodococcus triatomae]QNG24680.1 PQQ-binding-like beta-propeller repeat protein [Rhodococcus triatomae]SDH77990.1 PQQ-like domain-containing protein [Rhodococcus triatomae]
MQAPERRTRADLLIAAALALAIIVATGVVWLRSDARSTVSVTAETPAVTPEPAREVPATLQAVWDAPSSATARPVVAAGTVVSAEDGAVVGRAPDTGVELWRYERDLDLCGVVGAWQRAIAVYRDGRGCSQVTALDGASGARAAQRSSDADTSIELAANGTYVLARGDERLEAWRSDLVRTLEYGRVGAPVNPGTQPRSGCTLVDAAAGSSRLSVLERCPGESAERLTVLAPSPEDAQEPEEFGSSVLAEIDGPGARIVAVAGERTAVYLPGEGGEGPRVGIYDGEGRLAAVVPLPEPATDHAVTATNGSAVTWWTGSTLVAFDTTDLEPRWSLPDARGPAAQMADRLLVPVPTGLAVVDPATGVADRTLAVTRPQGDVPVIPAVIGGVVVEQRGDLLVALR